MRLNILLLFAKPKDPVFSDSMSHNTHRNKINSQKWREAPEMLLQMLLLQPTERLMAGVHKGHKEILTGMRIILNSAKIP